jgi:hypothetical protein
MLKYLKILRRQFYFHAICLLETRTNNKFQLILTAEQHSRVTLSNKQQTDSGDLKTSIQQIYMYMYLCNGMFLYIKNHKPEIYQVLSDD